MTGDECIEGLHQRLATVRDRVRRRQANVETLRAQIEVLAQELRPLPERQAQDPDGDLETDRGRPSLVLSIRMHRRNGGATGVNAGEGFREPIDDLDAKLVANQFAELHGIQVPRRLGKWSDPDAVEWESLPDRFVLKTERGGGAINVYPLERTGDGFIDRLTNQPVSRDQVTAMLWKRYRPEVWCYAEEFLVGHDGSDEIPPDIKVFCFYGEVGFLDVRTGGWSRAATGKPLVRMFSPDGADLANVRALSPNAGDLQPPTDFKAIREAASRLSRGIRRPVERLDFYETDHGLVFGEVTKNSGHPPALVPEWDETFGDMYEDAYARLLMDLVDEGALHVEYRDGSGNE